MTSDKKPDGGPAFPACNEANVNDTMGMTLRDWFAGQVMIGILSNSKYGESDKWFSDKAERSYHIADEMLKARGQ